MVDADLILKKLTFIETCVAELRTIAHPERIKDDIREERFVSHTLQLAIQAALDAASHIVSDERLGEPRTNRELFDLLAKGGWLSPELTQTMRDMAGFRNILVHGYQAVDVLILRNLVENRLDDLISFAVTVRSRMGSNSGLPPC